MNTPPKIALVANVAWNLYNFRRGLIAGLQQAGYQVVLIAPADDYVEPLRAMGCEFVPLTQLSRKGTNPLQDVRLFGELRRIYRTHRIDAVLQYTIKPNIYGAFAAHSVGIPSICTVTGLGYSFLSDGWVTRLVHRLYRWAFGRATRVVFQNEDDRQLFIDKQLVASAKTALIRGSGIDTKRFAPQPKDNPTSDTFVFLFVGRLLYDKGVRELLQAAALVRQRCAAPVEFWLVGALDTQNPSAISQTELDSYTQNGTVKYWGTTDNVGYFIKNVDAVVLPSYREGLPRVLLEALAMGKPIVATDAAGCRETVVEGENGYLVPVKDAESLANACLQMVALPAATREAMGAFGRNLAVQEFDEQVVIQRYIQLLKDILK